MLVLGSCHRGAMERVFLGDTARAAVHGAPCAIAIDPRGWATDAHPLRRVAVGYDGRLESHQATEWTVRIARRPGGSLALYHALEPVGPGNGPSPPAVISAHYARRRSAALDEAKARAAELTEIGVPCSAAVLEGSPSAALASAAVDADLLVVGSRGRGALGALLLGSTGLSMLRRAAAPVVMVPRSCGPGTPPAPSAERVAHP